MNVLDDVRRASLISIEKPANTYNEPERGPPPPDKFNLVGIVILTVGLTSMLSHSFIVTANDYWMYKFRDPSSETYNAENRTALQTNFTASLGVSMAIPSLIGLILAVTVCQKIKAFTRMIGSYLVLTICFLLFTLFVPVNTDNWQESFFTITMIKISIMSIVSIILVSSLIVSVPRLPQKYLKLFLYGQGGGALFSAILQIISLATGGTSIRVGLIYFGSGTVLYGVSTILFLVTKNLPFYNYYVSDKVTSTKASRPKLKEIKTVLKNMWPVLVLMALAILGQTTTHPTITSLIVSENYGNGDAWSQLYFVPVITFLVADIVGIIGRVFSKNVITRRNAKWFILINVIRTLIFPTLFALCNVKTMNRSRTPQFTHDWQYIIILSVFVFTGGYFQTCAVLSLINFKGEEESMELYYLMFQVLMTLLGLASSPLGVLMVNTL